MFFSGYLRYETRFANKSLGSVFVKRIEPSQENSVY